MLIFFEGEQKITLEARVTGTSVIDKNVSLKVSAGIGHGKAFGCGFQVAPRLLTTQE
ncbi:MAG: hypothetical protein ACLTTU_11270 [Bilophila wadsworthia]